MTERAEPAVRPRLLIVTTYFAPAQAVGGRRSEALARGMRDRGWDVTVLAPETRYTPPVDPSLEPPSGIRVLRTPTRMLPVFHRPRVPAGEGGSGEGSVRGALASLAKRWALRVLQETVLVPDHFTGWLPHARRAVAGQTFDVVLASVPFFRSAEVARVLARGMSAPLVLDYRDPWTDHLERCRTDVSKQVVLRNAWREARCLRAAAAVSAVTPTLCRWIERRSGRPCRLIRGGFTGPIEDPPGRSRAGSGDRPLGLVYAGSLSYGRSLEPLVRAVARLYAEVGVRARVRYVGVHAARAVEQARAAGGEEFLEALGPLDREQAQAHVRRADAAVVIVSAAYAYAIPGKLYDILPTGTPVLQLAPSGSDAEALVRGYGLGWSHPEGDVRSLARSLAELAAGRIPERERVDELSVGAMQEGFARLLEEVRA